MKIFWITAGSLAALGFQPAMAYQDALTGQIGPGPANNQATQRGQENKASRLRGYESRENSQSRSRAQQNVPPKPWEARPWEQAQDVRPDESRQRDMRKLEETRRAGRKARKERVERQKEKAQTLSYQDRVKQRQTKWQKHQLESERYVAGTLPRR
ncbi:hypothetical protein [Nitrosovibrio tenuis]|uniref:Uncharacterized protein n=1 Tax=Nitrosovibrio tenuis TaxID=1233 RepID=A0A1H7MIV2_9PROT|nr:hypothetical protein [Nitrosovibrio tenuis]SEL11250.1 hypothetical protein SAMN05216387_105106 [Nitrosovibrio tenuis]